VPKNLNALIEFVIAMLKLLLLIVTFIISGNLFCFVFAEMYTFEKKWLIPTISREEPLYIENKNPTIRSPPDLGYSTYPRVIGIDSSEQIYIIDNTEQIYVFNSNGELIKKLILENSTTIETADSAIKNDNNNNLYVLFLNYSNDHDYVTPQIKIFDNNGTFLNNVRTLGTIPTDPYISYPHEIDIDSNGNVYVIGYVNDYSFRIYSPEGKFLDIYSQSGNGEGEFDIIQGLTSDSLKNLYISDSNYPNDRIQKLNKESFGYYFSKMWGKSGNETGQFYNPMDLTIDNKSYIYVADSGNHRIQKFDNNGTFITTFGSYCDMHDDNLQINLTEMEKPGSGCIDPDGAGPLEKGDGQFSFVNHSVGVD
jgi:sugar lactone lactonase YvrE